MSKKFTTAVYRFSIDDRNSNTELNASLFGISFVVLSFTILSIAIIINGFLPEPLTAKDVPEKSPRFIAENAYKILEELSGIGPKVVGSYENEVLAIEVIKKEINKILQSTTNRDNEILYNLQTVSDCFNMTLKNFAETLCYQDIQNIVVKLKSPIATESILLNCHFDSVPTSPGASDNGLHCSVLLEILRILVNSSKALNRNVVFLFNGAEEAGLLGSHGFITKHRWTEDIVTFVNLDSCGAGGREILFQTGPRAYVLPKIYAQSVPYPHGAVFGEELFQSGVLPSDTDFRIFRDYGHLKGLDIAHYKNGYVYHTSSDDISHISKNVIQHSGDNLLALTLALIGFDDLKQAIRETDDQAVYMDVFGKFMIYYSTSVAYVVNVFAILLSVYSSGIIVVKMFRGMKMRYIYYHFLINFIFMGVGRFIVFLTLFFLEYILNSKGLNMLWYSNQWFVSSYYGVAALYMMTTLLKIRQRFFYSKLDAEEETNLFIIIIQMIHTFFLFVGTLLKIRSIFVFAVGLVPISICHIILNRTKFRHEKIAKKALLFTTFNFIPSLYITYLYVQITHLLIPTMGRIGSFVDSEMVMWLLCEFFVYFIFSYLQPLVLLVKNWWKIQTLVAVLFVVYTLVILYGEIFTPFSDDRPQRFITAHINRKFVSADDGDKFKFESNVYVIVPMDKQGPASISKLFKNHNFQELGTDVCEKELFCGIPPVAPYLLGSGKSVRWKPSEKAVLPAEKSLTYEQSQNGTIKTFHLKMIDVGFVDIVILPLNGAELLDWSLFDGSPNQNLKWSNKPVYLIRRYRGVSFNKKWSISIRFDVSSMIIERPVFKMAWSVYHMGNNTNYFTDEYRKIINKFPSWTRLVSWVIDYEEYIF